LNKGSLRWLLFVAVFAVGCDDSPQAPDPVPGEQGWRESQLVSIHEAVYRFQFEEHAAGAQPGTVTFCLARTSLTDETPWTDPSTELLRRFAGHAPAVKKFSLCRLDLKGDTDPATGTPALIFRAALPQFQSDTEALVEGGYHANGLSASGETYRVQFANGGWKVVEAVWRWVA
jgi:hypothetical protein